jgi:DNA/RNA endonuclease G (NUC1)
VGFAQAIQRMSDQSSKDADIERATLALEREKHRDELALRNRELDFKLAEQRKSVWRSPLFLAVVAGFVGLLSNALVALINGESERALEREKAAATSKLERQKAEAGRILEALKTGDPDLAAANLELLLKTRLLTEEADSIAAYLKARKPGEGASLPAPTGTAMQSAGRNLVFHDLSYTNRRGYDPAFLGVQLPPPQVKDASLFSQRIDGAGVVLPYEHFSLAVHKGRRLAAFTAANVDFRDFRQRPNPEEDYSRYELTGLGPGQAEGWIPEQRISPREQLHQSFFILDEGAFDTGHIITRTSVAWGDTYAELRRANGDAFHLTNSSPQVGTFNRPFRDKNSWGDLENQIAEYGRDRPLSVFAGPVLDDADPTFQGTDDFGPVEFKIPRRFWKVVVESEQGKLRSFAFLLEQDLSDVPLDPAVDSKPGMWLIPTRKLEEIVGLVAFPEVLHASDQSGAAIAATHELSKDVPAFP